MVLSQASIESEYQALANGAAKISWLQSLFQELHVRLSSPLILWCNNMSAGSLAANPNFHARTKHIEIDVHFVREKVLQEQLEVCYVPSSDQVADILTKVLLTTCFLHLRDKLNVQAPPFCLRGNVGVNDRIS